MHFAILPLTAVFSVVFKQKVNIQPDIGIGIAADSPPKRNNVSIPHLVMCNIGQQIVFGLTLNHIDILNVLLRLGFPTRIVKSGLNVVDVFVGDKSNWHIEPPPWQL